MQTKTDFSPKMGAEKDTAFVQPFGHGETVHPPKRKNSGGATRLMCPAQGRKVCSIMSSVTETTRFGLGKQGGAWLPCPYFVFLSRPTANTLSCFRACARHGTEEFSRAPLRFQTSLRRSCVPSCPDRGCRGTEDRVPFPASISLAFTAARQKRAGPLECRSHSIPDTPPQAGKTEPRNSGLRKCRPFLGTSACPLSYISGRKAHGRRLESERFGQLQ
jgi:hypothetical protein